MIPIVYPYKMSSQSAKDLARGLGCKRVYQDKRYHPKRSHMIINWGNSSFPLWDWRPRGLFLNSPWNVTRASNKINTFRILTDHNVPTPEWTTDITTAEEWEGVVFVRNTVVGRGGQGIEVLTEETTSVPQAPLYTKYTKAKHEYRVHIIQNEVIDFTLKKRFRDTNVNPYVKNYDNGWVFCRDSIELPEIVQETAIKAVAALELDFGAVDIAHRLIDNKVFVYEINTAPGIEGTTLIKYIEAFKQLL